MSAFKSRLSELIDVRNERNPSWIPARLRGLIRRVSGGDSWTAQMLRGLLWQYRWLVGLALVANIAAAVFEGSTMAIFTLALQSIAGGVDGESSLDMGIFEPLLRGLFAKYEPGSLFVIFIGLAVVSQLLRSGLQFGGQVATAYLTAWMEGDLRRRILRQFLSISYPQISRYKLGDLMSYVEQIVRVGGLISAVNTLISQLMIIVAYVLVLLWLSWPLTVGALVALLLMMTALRGLTTKIRSVSEQFMQANISFNEKILEYLQGIRLIHTFGRADYVMESVEPVVVDSVQSRRRSSVQYAMITPIYQTSTIVGVALFLGGGYIITGGDVGALTRLITFVFVLYRLLPFVTVTNNNLAGVYDTLPFAARLANILRTDDKEYLTEGGKPLERLVEKIEFRDVSLTYLGSERPALCNLTFTIHRGTMVAFVGASGAGKSSIINLLLHLYEPTSGSLYVDNHPLQEYRIEDWQSRIGIVDQDTFMFHDSVRDNIRFGKLDATLEEIEAAARIANANDFIYELSEGYETVVGDRGYRLSGGQRQRIAIARAVIRKPDVLLFDEATSALDSHSEQMIQQSIEHLRQDRTLIVIAHRLSTIAKADHIFVLDEGHVIEHGNHQTLLKLHGRYAEMWRLQSAGTSLSEPRSVLGGTE